MMLLLLVALHTLVGWGYWMAQLRSEETELINLTFLLRTERKV